MRMEDRPSRVLSGSSEPPRATRRDYPSGGPMRPFLPHVLAILAALILGGTPLPGLTPVAELEVEPDVVIVMKDKAFHLEKGGAPEGNAARPGFSLTAGEDIIILLQNDDTVAHEFVSPMLREVDLQLSGEATLVYTFTAAGVRVNPGEAVTLRFWLPDRFYDQFHFWCNVHGKLHDDKMRGEIFVLKSKRPSG